MGERVSSNISLERIFQFPEVGFLKSLLKEILESDDLKEYSFFIYFKKTIEEDISLESEKENQILIITGDESSFIPHKQVKSFKAIFKTYLPEQHTYKNLFHIPVGPNPFTPIEELIPYSERKYNLFFTGNLHKGRSRLFSYLAGKKLKIPFLFSLLPFSLLHRIKGIIGTNFSDLYPYSDISFTSKFNTGLDKVTYGQKLAHSKIVLCPPGNPSRETFRHFEAMKSGCIIISEKLPDHYCYRDSPIIVLDNWSNLDSILDDLFNKVEKAETIAMDTIEWYRNRVSEKGTVNYMINSINSLTNV